MLLRTVQLNFRDNLYLTGASSPGASSPGAEGDDEDDDVESLTCSGCFEEKDCCHCEDIIEGFSQLNSQFSSLGLINRVAEPAFLSVIHKEV